MDENKEALTTQADEAAEQEAAEIAETAENAEQAAEETAEETAEEATEEAAEAVEEKAEELDDGAADESAVDNTDTSDAAENTVGAAAEEAPKKKFPLQKTLIIALVIVALTAVAALVINVFFNKGVTGEWRFNPYETESNSATSDEPDNSVYYYFKFNNDGSATLSLGSTTRYGSYSLSKNDKGENIITLSLGNISGDFTYEASGNLFTGRKLKLTYATNTDAVLNLYSDSKKPHEFERKDEFKPSETLTGNWMYTDTMYGVTISFNLKDDGTVTYTEDMSYSNPSSDEQVVSIYTIDGIYDYTDTTFTLHYYDIADQEVTITYESKDGAMIINGNAFTKDGVATADSAKK